MAKKKGKKDGLSGLDAVVEAGKAKDRIAAAAGPDADAPVRQDADGDGPALEAEQPAGADQGAGEPDPATEKPADDAASGQVPGAASVPPAAPGAAGDAAQQGTVTGDGDGEAQKVGEPADAGAGAQGTGDPGREAAPAQGDDGDGVDQEDAPPQNRMDVNVLAAAAAASMAYGTTNDDSTTMPRMDASWLARVEERGAMKAPATCAAAFLRTWPDGKPDALAIHLRRAGFDVPEPGRRERVAWAIFAATLAGLDGVDKAEAAEREAEKRGEAQRPTAARREDLAYMPDDPNPLSELGRVAQKRL